jgi:hypothetical protein
MSYTVNHPTPEMLQTFFKEQAMKPCRHPSNKSRWCFKEKQLGDGERHVIKVESSPGKQMRF